MNVGLNSILKNVGSFLSKNKTVIDTVLTIGGIGFSCYTCTRATLKAKTLIEEKKKELGKEALSIKETIKTVGKEYIPFALIVSSTIGMVIFHNVTTAKEIAALNEVAIAEKMLRKSAEATYKKAAEKIVGKETVEKIEKEYKENVVQEKQKNKELDKRLSPTYTYLCKDGFSGRYFQSSVNEMDRIENFLNSILIKQEFVSLNDLYFELNLDPISVGDEVTLGSVYTNVQDDLISFHYEPIMIDGQPGIELKYDYGM